MLTGYPSIDKPWRKYYSQNIDTADWAEESIFQRLERCNKHRLETIALELRTKADDYDKGSPITYGQYIDKIKECARAFYTLGVEKNEIIPLLLPNMPESRILIYALNIVGATVYPISPMMPATTVQQIFLENHVKTLVILTPFFEKYCESILNSQIQHIVYLNGLVLQETSQLPKTSLSDKVEVLQWDEFMDKKQEIPNDIAPHYDAEHIAVIIGTSGTTGTPKGVCLTDINLNASAIGQALSDHYRTGEIILDCLPPFIGYGISTMHSFGCIGCHNILIPDLITKEFPELLCKIKPNCFPGGPVHYINLARSREFADGKVPYVRTPFCGGATLDRQIEQELNNVGEGYQEKKNDILNVRQGYGFTECCACATANAMGAYKFGSIGIPMGNVTVSIFKPGTDIECSYGEEGEICVAGPTVMKGYLNRPEETENVLKLHSDGKIWLHQADLGWCDSDGHFFITDRIKNIFMRMGFKIHPSKVTEFIDTLPGVKECFVTGVPHPDEQMVPVAFVVLESGVFLNEHDAKVALTQSCAENLSDPDVPYDWFFVDTLPRNPGGKIDKQILLQLCHVRY